MKWYLFIKTYFTALVKNYYQLFINNVFYKTDVLLVLIKINVKMLHIKFIFLRQLLFVGLFLIDINAYKFDKKINYKILDSI